MNGKNTPRRGKPLSRRRQPQPWRAPSKPRYSRQEWQKRGVEIGTGVFQRVMHSIRKREIFEKQGKKVVRREIVFSRTSDNDILVKLNRIITTKGAYDYLEGRQSSASNSFIQGIVSAFPNKEWVVDFLIELKKDFRGA